VIYTPHVRALWRVELALEDSVIGVLVGWLLGLASSIYFQDRSIKQQRHETTKERVYSPLYDEIEETLDRLKENQSIVYSQWIRITSQDHLGYLIEPPELYDKLRKLYTETDRNLSSGIELCRTTYVEQVKNDLMSRLPAVGTSPVPIETTLQAISDVATGVGANLVRGYVFPGDIHTFSTRFESLKPYVKDLTGTFQEYFGVWKKKVENDEMMIGYRSCHEQAVSEAKVLREMLGNNLRETRPTGHSGTTTTAQTMPEGQKLRAEERRALVLLGITAILASFLGAMLSVVWTGSKKVEDFFFNVPPVSSPIPHATFYWIYILEFMIGFWMVYAFFAFWYFSGDWLSPKVRKWCHYIATVFMGFYILYIAAFIPLTYAVVVLITDPVAQTIAFGLELLFISVLLVDFMKWATGVGRIAWIPRILRRIRKL
jgi:hypothetical protein